MWNRALLLLAFAGSAQAAEQEKIKAHNRDDGPSYWQADTAFRNTKPPKKVTGPFDGPLSKPPPCADIPSGIVQAEKQRGNCL